VAEDIRRLRDIAEHPEYFSNIFAPPNVGPH
jgi:hypothetical protein